MLQLRSETIPKPGRRSGIYKSMKERSIVRQIIAHPQRGEAISRAPKISL